MLLLLPCSYHITNCTFAEILTTDSKVVHYRHRLSRVRQVMATRTFVVSENTKVNLTLYPTARIEEKCLWKYVAVSSNGLWDLQICDVQKIVLVRRTTRAGCDFPVKRIIVRKIVSLSYKINDISEINNIFRKNWKNRGNLCPSALLCIINTRTIYFEY